MGTKRIYSQWPISDHRNISNCKEITNQSNFNEASDLAKKSSLTIPQNIKILVNSLK